ncbi:MAG: aminodeoxychorismate synthase component I, partial [Bacteroidales bacterium]
MMKNFTKQEAIEQINRWGAARKPFLFIIDYATEHNHVMPLDEIDSDEIRYDFNGISNTSSDEITKNTVLPDGIDWQTFPIPFENYQTKFGIVHSGLKRGDSFLINLTERTPVKCNLSLRQVFDISKARYRLWVKNLFCSLSPEIFVQIKGRRISSFPMKGTIDASIPDAEKQILENPKEAAEHATIVDLIRNDLSIHASRVEVTRYRYIDRLRTNKGDLLQVSSEISGLLTENYHQNLGAILYAMLPAGSICGAPKKSTCE